MTCKRDYQGSWSWCNKVGGRIHGCLPMNKLNMPSWPLGPPAHTPISKVLSDKLCQDLLMPNMTSFLKLCISLSLQMSLYLKVKIPPKHQDQVLYNVSNNLLVQT